jgi:hypothetical protein
MILAIDPGPTESAYLALKDDGLPYFFSKVDNNELAFFLENASDYGDLVIEEIQSFGMAVGKEVFTTARWTGVFEGSAKRRGKSVSLVGRQEVKLFWCQSPRAKDANVRRALLDHYGPPGTKKSPGITYGIKKDVWSALAIAGYWHAKQNGRA